MNAVQLSDSVTIIHGDCRETLKQIPDGTAQCCVTSPPYWGLRSYLPKDHPDKAREIGQEPTPEAFVETMVQVFREVRRCLHDSGTLWLNLGDSYNGGGPHHGDKNLGMSGNNRGSITGTDRRVEGLKPKDLCMIPWRVALALQADGWWLRSVIVWHKKSCMPESVTDRPTNSWEPIFLLAKSARYFWDAEAVKETTLTEERERLRPNGQPTYASFGHDSGCGVSASGRNQRNVWSLGPENYTGSHFAVFPTEIPKRAILAGTSAKGCCPKCYAPWERVVEKIGETPREKLKARGASGYATGQPKASQGLDYAGGHGNNTRETNTLGWQSGCKCNAGDPIPNTVLDPFGGSGTTGAVAVELGRRAILCELNDDYLPLIDRRTNVTPGLQLT